MRGLRVHKLSHYDAIKVRNAIFKLPKEDKKLQDIHWFVDGKPCLVND
jgi:hypothetical protein